MLLNYGVEEAIENHLDCKKIKPVSHKGNQSWIFLGGTDAEAEVPPDVKSRLIGKDCDAGKDWGQEEKGTTEDKMFGWHHQLDGLDLGGLRKLVMNREAWHAAVHDTSKSRTQLSDWTELNHICETEIWIKWYPLQNVLQMMCVK